ncbi:response regulator [Geomonas oryzisoli]|uniref:Response regulator n=1 Tax=Geomonas oryzisoli TaxID=2847992 RepID=A0ABX8JFR8_9BACT|nr:response regulator [Geomonas oryzisoli]QWV94365.1 response regulator [Geomonas oryzisoli]
MTQTIMIVEDEEKLASLLGDYLKQSGFETVWVANGTEVVPRVREKQPDLVLLDLMLPGRDGLEICKEIRTFSQLPIIMITARVEEIDRLLGLELGADDYICKPFSPREVVARVKTVLRRSVEHPSQSSGGLTLAPDRYSAQWQGRDLDLTVVEFKLLHFLFQNPGRIYSRTQLMDRIYPDQRIVSDRTIDSHIKKLRKKISAVAPDQELIHSIYGAGYKYEPPTQN